MTFLLVCESDGSVPNFVLRQMDWCKGWGLCVTDWGPGKLIMNMLRAALRFKLPTSALQLEHISL